MRRVRLRMLNWGQQGEMIQCDRETASQSDAYELVRTFTVDQWATAEKYALAYSSFLNDPNGSDVLLVTFF